MKSDGARTYIIACFCDASQIAFSAAIYIHETGSDQSDAKLCFSNHDWLHWKAVSSSFGIYGSSDGLRCVQFEKTQLRLPISNMFLWTDSKRMLQWIVSQSSQNVFVRNQVNEIRVTGKDVQMEYNPITQNPADIATRGT